MSYTESATMDMVSNERVYPLQKLYPCKEEAGKARPIDFTGVWRT